VNAYFAKDIADHRHTELMARAEQSRRYHEARQARLATITRTAAEGAAARGSMTVVRRPFAAVHAWLVAGVL
jgi:hypothetical protein